jgi:hypothetical protein
MPWLLVIALTVVAVAFSSALIARSLALIAWARAMRDGIRLLDRLTNHLESGPVSATANEVTTNEEPRGHAYESSSHPGGRS